VRVVVETRPKTYRHRSNANRVAWLDENGKHRVKFVDDPGGVGREAVREVIACPNCAARLGR
jgi:hypothetical protein